jgi:hypothetical protein
MTLAASGTMSIGGTTATRSINLELGRASNAQSSMGESALRTLAGVPSGVINMSDFYGKSNTATPSFDSAATFFLNKTGTGSQTTTLTFNTDGTISYVADTGYTGPTACITPTGSTTGISIRCNFTSITWAGATRTLTVFGTAVTSGVGSYDSGTVSFGGASKVITGTSNALSFIVATGTIYITDGTTTVTRAIDFEVQA